MNQFYLGTIGFSYKDWLGAFYPIGTPQKGYLPYYSKVFNCVEIDTTFHSVPRQSAVQSWVNTAPDGFKFCLKTPRRITHELGLKGAEGEMIEFLDSVRLLQEKLGPILIQLPPKFSQDNYSILDGFIESLPKNHQIAVEFRHPSWYNKKTEQLLSHHQVCWVSIDFPNIPKQIVPTTSFLYIRWIGINGMYQHHTYERVDKNNQLKWWWDTIQSCMDGTTSIYGFFNNDYAGFAAGTCKRFKLLTGLDDAEENIPFQQRLF